MRLSNTKYGFWQQISQNVSRVTLCAARSHSIQFFEVVQYDIQALEPIVCSNDTSFVVVDADPRAKMIGEPSQWPTNTQRHYLQLQITRFEVQRQFLLFGAKTEVFQREKRTWNEINTVLWAQKAFLSPPACSSTPNTRFWATNRTNYEWRDLVRCPAPQNAVLGDAECKNYVCRPFLSSTNTLMRFLDADESARRYS